MTQPADTDRGAVLVLTLILTVVLSVVVVALAAYVTVGIGTSDITDLRSETNADGAAVVTWAMEEFRIGSLDVSTSCPPTGLPIPLGSADGEVNINGSLVTLECQSDSSTGAFPVVRLYAEATKDGVTRSVDAVAQIAPPPDSAVRALDWGVDDVPIAP